MCFWGKNHHISEGNLLITEIGEIVITYSGWYLTRCICVTPQQRDFEVALYLERVLVKVSKIKEIDPNLT